MFHASGWCPSREYVPHLITSADAGLVDTAARGYASPWTIAGNVSGLAGYCLVGLVVRIAPGRQVFGRVSLLNTFLIEEMS